MFRSSLLRLTRLPVGVVPSKPSIGVRWASTKAVVLEKVLLACQSISHNTQVNEIQIRDIEIDEPLTPLDLRIDIKSVGICGSDVHYYQVGLAAVLVLSDKE